MTLVDTAEIAVKLIALFPGQCLPEHRHPPLGHYAGKAETLRCEWGMLYLCEEGVATPNPQAHPPEHRRYRYTAWQETVLHPGEQRTMPPNTLHCFQAGPEGAVVWSFSSHATDVQDVFTDPEIQRQTVVVES